MGSCLTKNSQSRNIVILGLEKSGKTTMLYQLSKNKQVQAIPTIGKNEEVYIYKGKKYSLLDFGGRISNFNSIRSHFQNSTGIIYMIDGSLPDKLNKSYELFKQILQEESLKGLPILIFLNKKDVAGAFSTEEEIKSMFKLQTVQNCIWKIVVSSALNKEGLEEGFEWLVSNSKSPTTNPIRQIKI